MWRKAPAFKHGDISHCSIWGNAMPVYNRSRLRQKRLPLFECVSKVICLPNSTQPPEDYLPLGGSIFNSTSTTGGETIEFILLDAAHLSLQLGSAQRISWVIQFNGAGDSLHSPGLPAMSYGMGDCQETTVALVRYPSCGTAVSFNSRLRPLIVVGHRARNIHKIR